MGMVGSLGLQAWGPVDPAFGPRMCFSRVFTGGVDNHSSVILVFTLTGQTMQNPSNRRWDGWKNFPTLKKEKAWQHTKDDKGEV